MRVRAGAEADSRLAPGVALSVMLTAVGAAHCTSSSTWYRSSNRQPYPQTANLIMTLPPCRHARWQYGVGLDDGAHVG
eukprot:988934-Rhodomonas_salina.1